MQLFLAKSGEPDQLVAFDFDQGFLFFQLLLLVAQILFALNQSLQLAVDQGFPFGQTLFEVSEFAAARAEGFFGLLAELESFFVGGEPCLARNGFGFPAGVFEEGFLLHGASGVAFALFPMEEPVSQQTPREEKRSAFPI